MRKNGLLNYMGSVGSVALGKFCPVCYPAIGAFLTAMGVGFALKAAVLKALLIFFLGVGVLGLWRSGRVHRNRWPVWIAVASSVFIYTGKYLRSENIIFYAGVLGLITAIIIDIRSARFNRACTSCKKPVQVRE